MLQLFMQPHYQVLKLSRTLVYDQVPSEWAAVVVLTNCICTSSLSLLPLFPQHSSLQPLTQISGHVVRRSRVVLWSPSRHTWFPSAVTCPDVGPVHRRWHWGRQTLCCSLARSRCVFIFLPQEELLFILRWKDTLYEDVVQKIQPCLPRGGCRGGVKGDIYFWPFCDLFFWLYFLSAFIEVTLLFITAAAPLLKSNFFFFIPLRLPD